MNQNPNSDFYSFVPPVPKDGEQPSVPFAAQAKAEQDRMLRLCNRRAYSRAGWAFAAMVVTWFFFSTLLSLVLPAFLPEAWVEHGLFSALISTLPLYAIGIPVLCLCLRGMPHEAVAPRRLGTGRFVLVFFMGLGLLTVGAIVGNLFMSSLGSLVA